MPELKAAIDLRIEAGGKEESTVLGYGVKLPCWEAAFANGVRGHALDYADGHLEAVFRIGVSVIPAALAVAERIGGVSGKEFITAVAVGEEILCRLGVSVARKRKTMGPWHSGILMGNFGATASAAKILGLNTDQTDRAFGIAFLKPAAPRGTTAPTPISAGCMAVSWPDRSPGRPDVAAGHPGSPGLPGVPRERPVRRLLSGGTTGRRSSIS